MDTTSLIFPLYPNHISMLKKSHTMEAKFVICCDCDFIPQDIIEDKEADVKQTSMFFQISSDCSVAQLLQSIAVKDSCQIIGPLATGKNLPLRSLFVHNLEFMREYQIMSDKWETENKGERRGSSWGRGRNLGNTAAVQIEYSQCGLLDCSPLKVFQSLNLSHIQSLR